MAKRKVRELVLILQNKEEHRDLIIRLSRKGRNQTEIARVLLPLFPDITSFNIMRSAVHEAVQKVVHPKIWKKNVHEARLRSLDIHPWSAQERRVLHALLSRSITAPPRQRNQKIFNALLEKCPAFHRTYNAVACKIRRLLPVAGCNGAGQ